MATIADIIFALSQRMGDRPALVKGGEVLTFSQLAARAGRTANAMAALGVGVKDRVAISTRDNVDFLAESMGAWLLGATVVPFDFRMPAAEILRQSDGFQVSCLIADRSVDAGGFTAIRRDQDWRRMVASASEAPPDTPSETGFAVITPTSGTTGRPVGIPLTHARLLLRCENEIRGRNRALRPFGVAGLLSFSGVRHHALGHLLKGAPLHFYPPIIDASDLIERLNADAIGFSFAVPTMVRAMIAAAEGCGQPVLPNIENLWCGGAEMSPEERLRAYETLTPGFSHCFASSLTGTVSLLTGEDLLARPDTDGRIHPDVRIEVVDEAGGAFPDGETGLLRMRCPSMAGGVIGGEDRTGGDRLRDGWAYTGDLARLSDGFLTISGRTGDMIVRGGVNVYPNEVEAVIKQLSGVEDCAVVGFASEREGQEIACFVVAPGLDEDDVRRHCLSSLAPDKRPRRIVIVDSLPRNANGKVLRRELMRPKLFS